MSRVPAKGGGRGNDLQTVVAQEKLAAELGSRRARHDWWVGRRIDGTAMSRELDGFTDDVIIPD